MATNTLNVLPPPRATQYNAPQTVSRTMNFADGITSTVVIGSIPAGSVVVDAGFVVTQAYNWGTNNLVHIGTTAIPLGFATSLSLATIGNIAWDEKAVSTAIVAAADTNVVATYLCTGTQATTGTGVAYVTFLPRVG